jgi:hypothetical protein
MSEPPAGGFRPTEYLVPITAVLLALLGGWLYFLVVKSRVQGKPLGPPEPKLEIRLPANAPR